MKHYILAIFAVILTAIMLVSCADQPTTATLTATADATETAAKTSEPTPKATADPLPQTAEADEGRIPAKMLTEISSVRDVTISEYDEDDNLICNIHCDRFTGEVFGVVKYSYENGRLTKKTIADGDTVTTDIYEYDENGWLIKDTYYFGDRVIQIKVYENRDDGKPVVLTCILPDGNMRITENYEYDADGNLVLMTSEDYTGDPFRKEYEYSDGHLVKETLTGGQFGVTSITTYDEDGNVIETYYEDGSVCNRMRYIGNAVECTSYENGVITAQYTEEKVHYSDKSVITTVYSDGTRRVSTYSADYDVTEYYSADGKLEKEDRLHRSLGYYVLVKTVFDADGGIASQQLMLDNLRTTAEIVKQDGVFVMTYPKPESGQRADIGDDGRLPDGRYWFEDFLGNSEEK